MVWTPKARMEKLRWLLMERETSNYRNLQIQKFLFFNEMFNKLHGKQYDISSLRAYENGPVFSNTYGDLIHEEDEFYDELKKVEINLTPEEIDNMKRSECIIKTLTDYELSELTHHLDLWKSKEERIANGERQIPIEDSDISEQDMKKISQLYGLYEGMDDKEIIEISDKRYVISKEDMSKLTNEHTEVLDKLSAHENLINPVYVSIEDGVLMID